MDKDLVWILREPSKVFTFHKTWTISFHFQYHNECGVYSMQKVCLSVLACFKEKALGQSGHEERVVQPINTSAGSEL